MILGASGVSSPVADALFMAVFLLLTVAAVCTGVFLITRFIDKPADGAEAKRMNFTQFLIIILAIGLVIRLIMTFLIRGYREDIRILTHAVEHVDKNGLSGYYAANGKLYPLTFLIYAAFGSLANLMDISTSSVAMQFFVKLPLIICDIVTALILYKLAKRYINGYVGLVAAGLFCICPVFFLASSVWGSVMSILTLGIVLSLYFVAQKNYLGVFASYSLTMLVSKDALYLFPLFAVFLAYNFVKGILALRQKKFASMRELFLDREAGAVIQIPLYLVASILVTYLISLPVIFKDYNANIFTWIYRFFIKPLGTLTYFGYNSLGIFNLFGKNGDELGAAFPSVVFAVIFAVIILGIVLLVYLSKKNRANLVLLGGYITLTLGTYFIDFTALNLVPALAVLLMAYLLVRDKRILQVFGVLSFAVFLNASAVLVSAGYLNNASDYTVSAGNIFYEGTTLLSGGFGTTILVIATVLAVLSHLYTTLILLDVSMSQKRKLLTGDEKIGYFKSLGNWLKIK